ncbi:MAG: phospholipase D-like domain-containing protein, partial [Candidatus Binatia bacterium]
AKNATSHAENNCLKAMLTAIQGAQKFIYIEGQFFQTAHGDDVRKNTAPSGPMAALTDITASPGYKKYAKQLGILGVAPADIPAAIRWSQVDDVRNDVNGKGEEFWNDLQIILKNTAAIKASTLLGASQESILNPIGEALARRIERSIYAGLPFHVYMVLPVHPEGTLNTLNIMTQLHLTMQSLVFGSESLVNRIRRAILVTELQESKKMSKAQALAAVKQDDEKTITKKVQERWKRYLTLLNLRNWEALESRPATEQIYVHSKLLIADDRVAILGSANINDRSQLGDRDSELAIIVRDDKNKTVKLDGVREDRVSENVHQLRLRLWQKIFGLMGTARPARSLEEVADKPAAKETWEAIQRIAHLNALTYQKAFPFLASVQGKASSIWPTWEGASRRLEYQMPFNAQFWRANDANDESLSWDANARATEAPPIGIQGFIVTLPTSWTEGENNLSGMSLTLMANRDLAGEKDRMLANLEKFDGAGAAHQS